MDRESVKAIELNGIVHNATKIGVQDGDCEDLVNLRFKDGSWRASGDGKHVFSMQYQSDVPNTNGVAYTQLYIHTNVYRHILGVRNNTLYWFGNIDADGVFEALDVPAELTSVSGDLYICQTGHLLTIIDDTGGFDYLLFKPADTLYKKCYVDENGSQTDRGVFPFGQIHFNWADAGEAGTITEDKTGKDGWRKWGGKSSDWNGEYPWFGGAKFKEISGGGKESLHNEMVAIYGKAKEKNYFTDPFLVCAAIKLYDGKYMYASAPALIYPRQRAYNFSSRYTYPQEKNPNHQSTDGDSLEIIGTDAAYSCNAIIGRPKAVGTEYRIENYAETRICADLTSESGTKGNYGNENNARKADENTLGVFRNGVCTAKLDGNIKAYEAWKFQIRGVNLCVHFDSDLLQTMRENKDVFQSLCIFVTTQSPIYDMEKCSDVVRMAFNDTIVSLTHVRAANASYLPTRRKDSEIRYDLLNSPFYLLREYTQDELQNLLANPVVDLQDVKYKGLLENITQQNTLSVEASSRYSYIPKAQYNYNGRLHIANYTQTQFHGYPLDTFHLNNHSLRYKSGEQFMETLDNVIGYYDDTLSEPRAKYSLVNNGYVTTKGTVSAYVETEIETSEGIQKVCRYIPLGGNKTLPSGDFIEQPGALITFPDSRAKKMTISILQIQSGKSKIYSRTFDLKAHASLNMAYYFTDDLKPLPLTEKEIANNILTHTAPEEERVTETYPNGLKVSSTNNPLYFPVENTYQVGSSEIMAMMSNSVAVGTGQTGSAPLYIFCKDGVYAMFVDDEGKMAYTNSRVLARDVCNNAKSVTFIDSGVVFTTDRGLMEIAGEQVQEIGQPLEGDWAQFTTAGHIDYSKIAANAYYMKRIAALPDESDTSKDSMTQTDFLSYLKGCIINYNHNEFELMVSNPAYNYTYILDKKGNWSRRDYRANEYVNNYPTSYRVDNNEWYQVDKESDADNSIFLMSHILKMDSIGFKELHRVVARGYWQTISKKEYKTIVVKESNKTVELSPANGTIDAWSETLLAESYTKTIDKELYRYDIPKSSFDRELICQMGKQTLLFKCMDGCSIDTDKDNELEITYTIYTHYYSVVDSITITDSCKITKEGITITTPATKITNAIAPRYDYYVIIKAKGVVYLKGDNRRSESEFDFERFMYNDNACPLACTTQIDHLVDSYRVLAATISTESEELCFATADMPAEFREEFDTYYHRSKYLVIPEGYEAELTLKFDGFEKDIESHNGQNIIAQYTDGSGTNDVTKPTFAFQIIKEDDDKNVEVIYERAMSFQHFGGTNSSEEAGTVTTGAVSYTVYSKMSVGCSGDEKTLQLTAGKYRQRIVGGTIYTLSGTQPVFSGLEQLVTYHCKAEMGKVEETQFDYGDYDTIDIANQTITTIQSDDTAKLVSFEGNTVVPMSNIDSNDNPQYIIYRYDTDGNAIGFTIPDGMSANIAMTFTPGDEGLLSKLHVRTSEGNVIKKLDNYESSAGYLIHRIVDNNGNIVWSDTDNAAFIGEGDNIDCDCYSGIDSVEDRETVNVELPSGTYRMELEWTGVELCMDKSAEPIFSHFEDFSIGIVLTVGYNRNTYGMNALTIPNISQTTILTIPEHTETVVDTDKTYDTILGLYIFGSYDGRKWALLGHREKNSDFRDIGALVERTDCRFFRFVLAGQVSKDSRFDYFEVSTRPSKLNGKIR